jgi:hypothetical protein
MNAPAENLSSPIGTLRVIRSQIFDSFPEIRFGFSSRCGGVSPEPLGMNLSFRVGDNDENVLRNRQIFFESLNISPDRLAIPAQVHGNTVLIADAPGKYDNCDALISNTPGLFVCVTVADCVPVFLFDPLSRVVAAVHTGWRGTAKGMVDHTIAKLVTTFETTPSQLRAYIGPCAGPCCYEVGEDVASLFDAHLVSKKEGRLFLDLRTANVKQLLGAGVPTSSIEVSPLCTIDQPLLLHSHRRDQTRSGRMMGVIGLIQTN